jgi:hypothetical protein
LYNTDGEEITIEEWEARAVKKAKEARAARLEAKRRTTKDQETLEDYHLL